MFNNKVPYQTALSESKINYFSRKSIHIYQFNIYPNIDSKAISSFEIDGFVIANSSLSVWGLIITSGLTIFNYFLIVVIKEVILGKMFVSL